jgi:hypothetical protein
MNYQDTPCAACNLTEHSEHTIEYDEERGEKRQTADRRLQTTDHGMQTANNVPETERDESEEEVLPVSVMREIVAALLTMPTEIRNAVCWRYAGFEYQDVAKVQNCTMAAVEIRHTRALRRWPVLKALFPEKVARQARRMKKRSQNSEVRSQNGGSKTELVGAIEREQGTLGRGHEE